MATANLVDSMLAVTFDGGVDATGKPITMVKRFNGVKVAALEDQLYTIITALAPLQSYPVLNVKRNNTIDITA